MRIDLYKAGARVGQSMSDSLSYDVTGGGSASNGGTSTSGSGGAGGAGGKGAGGGSGVAPGDESGCGCHTAGGDAESGLGALGMMVLVAVLQRRRREARLADRRRVS